MEKVGNQTVDLKWYGHRDRYTETGSRMESDHGSHAAEREKKQKWDGMGWDGRGTGLGQTNRQDGSDRALGNSNGNRGRKEIR